MEKKGRGTFKVVVLNSVLFLVLLLHIWIYASALLINEYYLWGTPLTTALLFILGILFLIFGKPHMSVFNKLLPFIPAVASSWKVFIGRIEIGGSDAELVLIIIVSALSCLALVILTVRKLVSTRNIVHK